MTTETVQLMKRCAGVQLLATPHREPADADCEEGHPHDEVLGDHHPVPCTDKPLCEEVDGDHGEEGAVQAPVREVIGRCSQPCLFSCL